MASLFRRQQSPAVQVTPPADHQNQTLTSRFSVDVPKTSSWFSTVKRQAPIAEETSSHDVIEITGSDQPIRTSNATDDYVRISRTQPEAPAAQPLRVSEHTPRTNSNSDNANASPLTTLYLVSGLPKSPHTWTLADHDSVSGVHHSEGAVGRWWRAEVLGSTVTPGVGGTQKKKGKRSTRAGSSATAGIESAEGKAGLAKGDLGKMLSKSLKLSFTREVEIIASTLQPASTVHTFTFSIPSSSSPGLHSSDLRSSVFSSTSAASGTVGDRSSGATFPYIDPTLPRPSSSYLGPSMSNHLGIPSHHHHHHQRQRTTSDANAKKNETTYYGVCLTVWSHADEERSVAIRRTLETAARQRAHKSSMSSMATSIAASTAPSNGPNNIPGISASINRPRKRSAGGNTAPWSNDGEDFESETDGGAVTESEADFPDAGAGAGASTLFLPQNTVFWLPYALTLVSKHPIYDLMRDYLTLSWARFSKDVQSHTLQIAKILEAPAPRSGDIVRIDAGTSGETLEVICRFPGGLDFGRGLVDVNFTMWPLFRCLNLDNILTLCEIALAPTGRILFLSRHPAILGIAVSTLKYLVELRGWNGVAFPNLHARDARIYLEDPGPWIVAMSTEARYCVRPSPEVCICDLDINYVNCASPPPGAVSVKQQRDKFRRILMSAFDQYFHPDHGVPSEFKEAFPAGRFRPLCKIQSKRGSSVVAESIKPPEWWHQTRVVSAFDTVLKEKVKKPSLIKRISTFGLMNRPAHQLTEAERMIQASIRKRATAFVDARDDLETKIGRLSRRLNFLMTESELWRQKFVAFEGYAEKLSAEASELRGKIGKEQRESRRLSGLVSVTAHEKALLHAQLVETEEKHKDAVVELERMRQEMEDMEDERAKMVEEVEAQIERALASMAFSSDNEDFSDYSIGSGRFSRVGAGGSRPGSAQGRRPGSAAGVAAGANGHPRALRSIATASTLASDAMIDRERELEDALMADDTMVIEDSNVVGGPDYSDTRHTLETLQRLQGEHQSQPRTTAQRRIAISGSKSDGHVSDARGRRKRFSASGEGAMGLDGLSAVDQGISERSDKVAERVMAIQMKLDQALAQSRRGKAYSGRATKSEAATSADERPGSSGRARPPRANRLQVEPLPRARTSSNVSHNEQEKEVASAATSKVISTRRPVTPISGAGYGELTRGETPPVPSIPSQHLQTTRKDSSQHQARLTLHRIASGASLSATRPITPDHAHWPTTASTTSHMGTMTPAVTTDDSDDSYMSAYSISPPRNSDYNGTAEFIAGRDTSSSDSESGGLRVGEVAEVFGKRPSSRRARERVESTATERGKAEARAAAAAAATTISASLGEGSPTVSEYSTKTTRLRAI